MLNLYSQLINDYHTLSIIVCGDQTLYTVHSKARLTYTNAVVMRLVFIVRLALTATLLHIYYRQAIVRSIDPHGQQAEARRTRRSQEFLEVLSATLDTLSYLELPGSAKRRKEHSKSGRNSRSSPIEDTAYYILLVTVIRNIISGGIYARHVTIEQYGSVCKCLIEPSMQRAVPQRGATNILRNPIYVINASPCRSNWRLATKRCDGLSCLAYRKVELQ